MTSFPARFPARSVLASALGAVLSGALAVTLVSPSGSHPQQPEIQLSAANPVTPGNVTAWAFDQCQAPSQAAMDAWLSSSPYLGVGIYIAGKSRGCRNQTYLNATWVHNQLARGWKLLPITLGPQASCNSRFPRYGDDPTISPTAAGTYQRARSQGIAQANDTAATARALGLTRGSTMYYDLEAFDVKNTPCRASALWFLSSWTQRIHQLGYLSGVYSSAGSGIKALDDARVAHARITYPDQVWIADWDGKPNTSSAYVRADGWQPHRRVKQFQGGHNETWGGVTIDIDRDVVDTGRGTVAPVVKHCGGVRVDFPTYVALQPAHRGYRPDHPQVKALKCFLRETAGIKSGKINGAYGPGLKAAVAKWQRLHHFRATGVWGRGHWVVLFSTIANPVLKVGSGSEAVRDLQRALATVSPAWKVRINGAYKPYLAAVVKLYQRKYHLPQTGVVSAQTWYHLRAGHM